MGINGLDFDINDFRACLTQEELVEVIDELTELLEQDNVPELSAYKDAVFDVRHGIAPGVLY